MAFRGERFVLDLDEESGAPEVPSPFSLVGRRVYAGEGQGIQSMMSAV
jgi:hypothetical protein